MMAGTIKIERQELGSGAGTERDRFRYIAVWGGDTVMFPCVFASAGAERIGEHYVLTRFHGRTGLSERRVLKDIGKPEKREEELRSMERPFGVEHEYESTDQRCYGELMRMVKRREGRRKYTTIEDLT